MLRVNIRSSRAFGNALSHNLGANACRCNIKAWCFLLLRRYSLFAWHFFHPFPFFRFDRGIWSHEDTLPVFNRRALVFFLSSHVSVRVRVVCFRSVTVVRMAHGPVAPSPRSSRLSFFIQRWPLGRRRWRLRTPHPTGTPHRCTHRRERPPIFSRLASGRA